MALSNTIQPVRQGKVRDLYDLGEHLLLVATDRISAFDWILPSVIPDKGRVLTEISLFWFDFLGTPNHLITGELENIELPPGMDRDYLCGRAMVVRKCNVIPIECVVRGYLVGSGWRDYQRTGEVCGHKLPEGLPNCAKFPEPLFTPATKAESGHDENISFAAATSVVGEKVAEELRKRSLEIYKKASAHAEKCGIILADTKFEFGWAGSELLLIDEVLTPDSSRFWPAANYKPGQNQPSFDKQFVREYLETTNWDKNSPPPSLPKQVIDKTREKYVEAYERLTGRSFKWK